MVRTRTRALAFAALCLLAYPGPAWNASRFEPLSRGQGGIAVPGAVPTPRIQPPPGLAPGSARGLLDSRALRSAFASSRILSLRIAKCPGYRNPQVRPALERAREATEELEQSLLKADELWFSEDATDAQREHGLERVHAALERWERAAEDPVVQQAVADTPEAPVSLSEVRQPLQALQTLLASDGGLSAQAAAAARVFSENTLLPEGEKVPEGRMRASQPAPAPMADPAGTELRLAAQAHRPAIVLRDFKAQLIPDNAQALAENVAMLDRAVSKAGIATFQWHNDAAGRAVAWAAIQAARRGVDVEVYIDSLQIRPRDRALVSAMAAEGVKVRHFRPPFQALFQLHKRLHDKAMWVDTADGKVQLMLGGRNKGDYYLHGDDVFDLDVRLTLDREAGDRIWRRQFEVFRRYRLSAPWWVPPWHRFRHAAILAELEASSRALARFSGGVPRRPELPVGWGVFARNAGHRASATRLIEAVLGAARAHVTIANAYFIPSPRVRRTLHDLLAAGVYVDVFSNSTSSTPHFPVVHLMRRTARRLLRAGMGLYVRLRGELHAKAAAVDSRFLAIGSTNLDPRSETRDTQNGVILDSPELARQFEDILAEQVRRRRYRVAPKEKTVVDTVMQELASFFETEL